MSETDGVRDASSFCDQQWTLLSEEVKEKTLTTQGASFTGYTKCSYVIASSLTGDNVMAPAFTLKESTSNSANFDDYSLNYVEYTQANTVTVGSGALYPAISDGYYPLVTYSLNPENRHNEDPSLIYPGMISCSYSGSIVPSASYYQMPAATDSSCYNVLL